jgi:hypothetical protein
MKPPIRRKTEVVSVRQVALLLVVDAAIFCMHADSYKDHCACSKAELCLFCSSNIRIYNCYLLFSHNYRSRAGPLIDSSGTSLRRNLVAMTMNHKLITETPHFFQGFSNIFSFPFSFRRKLRRQHNDPARGSRYWQLSSAESLLGEFEKG